MALMLFCLCCVKCIFLSRVEFDVCSGLPIVYYVFCVSSLTCVYFYVKREAWVEFMFVN